MLQDAGHMRAISDPYKTVSDKIRALAGAGYPRADIARFLRKRYQHVRNVLEGDAQRGYVLGHADVSGVSAPGVEEAAAEPYAIDAGVAVLRLPVRDDGALALPPMALAALGLRPGSVAIAELEGDRLTVFSVTESIRRVQAMVRDLIPGEHSLVDGLIAERRAEVVHEENG
jgi:hypothetical protein